MAANSRFFIIRADGSTLTVKGDQLASMRQSGFIGPDDKVIPVPGDAGSLRAERRPAPSSVRVPSFSSQKFAPAVDDIDTAPIEYRSGPAPFSDLEDREIEQAFSSAVSQSLYQLEAEKAQEAVVASDDALKTKAQGVQKQFSLRFSDGRVLGPFDSKSIELKIRERSIDESTQISDFGSDNFVPVRERSEFFILFLYFVVGERPAEKGAVFQVREASVASFLLELAHRLQTGWLYLKSAENLFLMSMAMGKIRNVYCEDHPGQSLEDIMKSVFECELGQAWFEVSPRAALDDAQNEETTVQMCRRFTSPSEGFALSRLLRVLGDQSRLLQPRPSSLWLINEEELTALEKKVIERATHSLSVHTTLHRLQEEQTSEESAIHALFFCQIGGITSFLSEKESQDLQALYAQLASPSFIDLLPTTMDTPDEDIIRELTALKSRVQAATKPLSVRDPLRQKLRERVNEIYDQLLDPAERYAFFAARERGEDIFKDPQLRDALKREFLERRISQLFEKGEYANALPVAEKYFQLAPNDDDASTKYLLSKFFSAATRQAQVDILGEMKERLRSHGRSVELLLALVSANLELRDFGESKKFLKRARKLASDDARIDTLQGYYNTLSLAETEVRGSGPIGLVSTIWVSLITIVLTAILWVLANDLGLGANETGEQALDTFIIIRTVLIFLAASVGFYVLHKKGAREFFSRFKWELSLKSFILTALIGALLGGLLYRFSVINEELSVFGFLLLFLSTLVDRVYFSGLVAYDLFNSISRRWIAVLWVSLLYATYYGSFHEVVHSGAMTEVFLRIFVLFVGLALPMALLQSVTKAVMAPIVFQVCFVISAKLVTHFGDLGPVWFGKW